MTDARATGPITTVVHLRLNPAVPDAGQILARMLPQTREFDGCLGVSVVADLADANHLILIERWASEEHDRAYRTWRAEAAAAGDGPAFLSAPPEVSRCAETGY